MWKKKLVPTLQAINVTWRSLSIEKTSNLQVKFSTLCPHVNQGTSCISVVPFNISLLGSHFFSFFQNSTGCLCVLTPRGIQASRHKRTYKYTDRHGCSICRGTSRRALTRTPPTMTTQGHWGSCWVFFSFYYFQERARERKRKRYLCLFSLPFSLRGRWFWQNSYLGYCSRFAFVIVMLS